MKKVYILAILFVFISSSCRENIKEGAESSYFLGYIDGENQRKVFFGQMEQKDTKVFIGAVEDKRAEKEPKYSSKDGMMILNKLQSQGIEALDKKEREILVYFSAIRHSMESLTKAYGMMHILLDVPEVVVEEELVVASEDGDEIIEESITEVTDVGLDVDQYYLGYIDGLKENENRLKVSVIDGFYQLLEEKRERYTMTQIEYLKEKEKERGVSKTETGLLYKAIKKSASLKKPSVSDNVEVHYEGTLTDGTVFDSSYKRGDTVTFPLDGVIPGWTEGLQLMVEGDIFELYIPSELAYGDREIGGIPANSALTFKVELIKIIPES